MNFCIFLMLIFRLCCSNKMYLDSANKFQNLLISIDNKIDEGDGSLLTRIKEHMNKASISLWKATSNMDPNKAGVQFGTVHIKVPKTWNIAASRVTWQKCNTAVFEVLEDREDNNNEPMRKQLGKCGEPGNITKFTKSFFRGTSGNELIKAGKEIMNEFVMLRYGVYSEKPKIWITHDGQKFLNSVCGQNITWKLNKEDYKCMEPNSKCNYTIVANQNHTYSVMFDTDTPSSEYFCDDKMRPHNKFARNIQNSKCKGKSVTNIILRHDDFRASKNNYPLENVNFRIVKEQNRRIVLVLDTSSSMGGIIDNMRKATSEFVNGVEDSASVGLVEFNSIGIVKSWLLAMNDRNNRNALIALINTLIPTGYTNIPDGLAKGIEVLGGNIGNSEHLYGSIFLLTDGQNNRNIPYNYEFAISQVIAKQIHVNAIAYGTAADSNINKLTSGTGGTYFFANPALQYTDLLGKLSFKLPCEASADQEIKINDGSIVFSLVGKEHLIDLTYLDDYAGIDIKLTVSIPENKKNYAVIIIGPTNSTYTHNKIDDQNGFRTLKFIIPGKPKVGMYRVKMTLSTYVRFKRSVETITLKFTVTAKPEPNKKRTINPTGQLSNSEIDYLIDTSTIQATVDLTNCGILKTETVTVTLFIQSTGKADIVKKMSDDGMGEDSIENDHVFTLTLYAKDLDVVGFYNFHAQVEIFNKKTNVTIKRTVELGSLRVKQKQPNSIEDKIPPSKIENLKLNVKNSKMKILTVQIDAPGNDGMIGEIKNYEILINSTETLLEKKTIQAAPRDHVKFDLDLSKYNVTNPFEISVRGIDDKNNAGEWSSPQIYNWDYTQIFDDHMFKKKDARNIWVSFKLIIFCLFIIFGK